MSAPDFTTLFQHEKYWEYAAVTLLTGRLPGTVMIAEHEQKITLASPCVQVHFQYEGEGNHEARYTGVSGATLPQHFLGSFRFTVSTQRVSNTDSLYGIGDIIRGTIRSLMAHYGSSHGWSTPGLLPYSTIQFCKENAPSYSIDDTNNLDKTEMAFEIQYTLNPDAYPAF